MSKHLNTSHPYIEAQKKKKRSNQGISSSSYCNNNQNIFETQNKSRQNRKRKFIETFEDDEEGRNEYNQSLINGPPSKQHISEQTVMKSIRNNYLFDNDDEIDLNSIDHTLNKLSSLSISNIKQSTKRGIKRKFNDIMINNDNDKECKDMNINICRKKRKYTHCNQDNNDNNDKMKEQIRLELIPTIIEYAELINNPVNDLFVTKLSRSDNMLQRMRLNKYNGALIKYRKPSKSWQELIKNYYKNNKLCDVQQFTKMDQEEDDLEDDMEDDFEMNDNNNNNNKKKKRAIRLHPSYTGFTKDNFMNNSEELKKIANQCYVSTVKPSNSNKNDNNNHCMDCD